MRIGLVILPSDPWPEARRQWEWAARIGFHTVWTYDHIRWGGMRDGPWHAAVPVLAAAGYAVFPTIGKGGLVVGGAGGQGILFEKGMATGWTKMKQVSVGATVGGQSYAEVIIFKEQSALNDFKKGQFAVASDASAVAGGAGASQSLKYTRGIAVMTMAKGGLMAEASIGGQKFSFKEFEHPIAPVPKT